MSRSCYLMLVLLGFTALAAAQGTEQELVRILQSGALTDRYQAARDVLQIPPQQRSEALWLALATELQRVASESHERTDALIAGRQVLSLGEEHSEYYADLITAVADWRDPRALPPLISSVGRGMLVVKGIVPFGELAVPLLIEAARTGPRSERGGALGTLGILLEGRSTVPYFPPAQFTGLGDSNEIARIQNAIRFRLEQHKR